MRTTSELLLAGLPDVALEAWGSADGRYIERLVKLWRTHRPKKARKPADWKTRAPAELQRLMR